MYGLRVERGEEGHMSLMRGPTMLGFDFFILFLFYLLFIIF
jgi:hypothetical protein